MPNEIPPAAQSVSARLAALLFHAHATGAPVETLPDDFTGLSRDEAFAVQSETIPRLGTVIGWKVGRKSPAAVPGCAPLFANRLYPSGTLLARDLFRTWQIEAELILRLGQDLPGLDRPYTRADMTGAVESVSAAFEILDSRYSAWPDLPAPVLLADLLSHGAMVMGSGSPLPVPAVFDTIPVTLTIDGVSVASHTGGNPAGDALDLLTWLANERVRTGSALRRGDLVTTGSCTGIQYLAPGRQAEATFEGIGSVSLARDA